MICTTIQNKDREQILDALARCEMAEIRLDRCNLSLADIGEIFSSDVPLVATCRISEIAAGEPSLQELPEQSRMVRAMQIAEKRLICAIEAGARYVDVEIEAPKQMSKRVRASAHENGTVFIRSCHDFSGTDSFETLKALVEKCVWHGADMVKIVTFAHSQEDVDRVMSLYRWCRDEGAGGNEKVAELAGGGLIAFCMGEHGRDSRLEALRLGAPYTYAALSLEDAAAPGQWPAKEMQEAVYGDFRFIGGTESGSMYKMPSSKSFAQRAIIAAALADGLSHLRGYTSCGDNEAAIEVARSLGAKVWKNGNDLTIEGIDASKGCLDNLVSSDGTPSEDNDGCPVLHVGESGLLTRMMIPLMAQLCRKKVAFTGEKTLLGRPLTGAKEIMDAFGAETASYDGSPGAARTIGMTAQGVARPDDSGCRPDVIKVPLTVKGPLKTGRAEISGKHGSQLISGLLMALPFGEKNTTLVVHEPKSIPYMFITLEVLKKFGIKVGNEMLGGRDFLESDGDWSLCTEMVFKVKGGQKFKAADMDLEGDWSAAANFLVAGALFGKLEIEGLDTTSLQADLSIMDILMDAGASLSQIDGARGVITVQRAPLKSFDADASNCPDLFPVIAVLAAFCQGISRISGVSRLANKESDRATAIMEMLHQMGVDASIEDDDMLVEGHSLAQRLLSSSGSTSGEVGMSLPRLLKGGVYSSHHDHRMVMALKVASLGADSPIIIDDEDCVSKSFPQFNELFDAVFHNRMQIGCTSIN